MMIKNIRHTGIVIDDIYTSLHFYQDLLGFKIVKQLKESGDAIDKMLGLKNCEVTTIKMELDSGQMLELLNYHTHKMEKKVRAINDIGPTHIALSVSNIDREYSRLKDAGVVFTAPPQDSADGYAKVAFCIAPEGTFVELVEELEKKF